MHIPLLCAAGLLLCLGAYQDLKCQQVLDLVTGGFALCCGWIAHLNGQSTIGVGTLDALRTNLETLEVGVLMGLFLQSFLLGITMWVLNACIFIIIYGRMLEIYLMTSLGAIPLATMGNREWNLGQNYLKSLMALGFQGFLIMVCVGIYAVLIQSISVDGDPIGAMWSSSMA